MLYYFLITFFKKLIAIYCRNYRVSKKFCVPFILYIFSTIHCSHTFQKITILTKPVGHRGDVWHHAAVMRSLLEGLKKINFL